jgi:hypothetical protein
LQITKVRLDLIEETPRAVALRWKEAATMPQPAMDAARDGAEDVQVGDQRLWRGGLGTHGRLRRVIRDAQHE